MAFVVHVGDRDLNPGAQRVTRGNMVCPFPELLVLVGLNGDAMLHIGPKESDRRSIPGTSFGGGAGGIF